MITYSSKLTLYTDGACSGNPGPGTYAFICLRHNQISHEFKAYESHTTNNRMELLAVISAAEYMQELAENEVVFYTDSKYVADGYNKWSTYWKKNGWKNARKEEICNLDLWKRILSHENLKIEWVKGHANDVNNNRVNNIAQTYLKDRMKKLTSSLL